MLSYRPDVDGLRALAVIPVLFFHANFSFAQGGFLGVDIFFVISGYLITAIILRELADGSFTLLGFYERRVRRIIPALSFVLLCSIPPILLLALPYQATGASEAIAASVLFVSNVLFWLQQDYFAVDAQSNPFVHTWSLSVEEQFYIVYPIFLMLIALYFRQYFLTIIISIGILSLAVAQFGGNFTFRPPFIEENVYWFNQPSWASFYLPIGRIWEFALGAIVAHESQSQDQNARPAQDNALSIAGLMAIVLSFAFFDEDTPHPSIFSLLPVAGTFLILRHSKPNTITFQILSQPTFVGIGLISYSLYLWHQPLYTYYRWGFSYNATPFEHIPLIVLTLILSYFTWRYIERPFRNRKLFSRPTVFASSAAISLLLLLFGLYGIQSNGFANRFQEADADLLISPEARGHYVRAAFSRHQYPAKTFDNTSKRKALIIGDSYAMDFFNMAKETNILDDYQVRTIRIEAKCQIYQGDEPHLTFVDQKDRALCAETADLRTYKTIIQNADVVFLSAFWKEWSIERLPTTIRNLNLREDQRLILLGIKNFGPRKSPTEYLGLSLSDKTALRGTVMEGVDRANKKMIEIIGEGKFVNIIKVVCGENDTCPQFTPDGHLLSYDGNHLTKNGAVFVGSLLKTHPLLSNL